MLFRKTKAQGFAGRQRGVLRWAQERRELPAPSTPGAYRETAVRSKVAGSDAARTKVGFSSRQLAWLSLRDEMVNASWWCVSVRVAHRLRSLARWRGASQRWFVNVVSDTHEFLVLTGSRCG